MFSKGVLLRPQSESIDVCHNGYGNRTRWQGLEIWAAGLREFPDVGHAKSRPLYNKDFMMTSGVCRAISTSASRRHRYHRPARRSRTQTPVHLTYTVTRGRYSRPNCCHPRQISGNSGSAVRRSALCCASIGWRRGSPGSPGGTRSDECRGDRSVGARRPASAISLDDRGVGAGLGVIAVGGSSARS